SLHPTFFTDRMTPRLGPGNNIADGSSIKLAVASERRPSVGLAVEHTSDANSKRAAGKTNYQGRSDSENHSEIVVGAPKQTASALAFGLLSSMILVRRRRWPARDSLLLVVRDATRSGV